MLTESFELHPKAEPRVAPGWFECFEAEQIGNDLANGNAVAFWGQRNIEYGIDRVVAIYADGRGYVWHEVNDCGDKLYDEDVLSESPTVREERKGPRVDAPEKAIEGFLRGAGLSKDQLEVRDEKKGQVYFATIEKPGRPAADIIAEVLEHAIRNFPWPKSMRWGAGALRWVRPLHSIICVLSDDVDVTVVPVNIDGIESGNQTLGHRFMSSGAPIIVSGFDDYAATLKKEYVILDPEERAQMIWQDATNIAFASGL
ncbi:MAG: glycine--tRNA ligase subunit beta, partial [Rhodobacteraceae bacterium]|nr:glycine--tRNA ligase subunit beta [Paracoccaceae bacterium]